MYSSLLDIIYIQQHDDLTDTHLLYKTGEIDKHTRMYAHMCAHAPMHADTHMHTCERMHTHMHTHTHTTYH